MRAVVITEPGGPDVLVVKDVPDPSAGPGQVVIAIEAAGVNRADRVQRAGRYNPPPGAPPYPGLECAGTIAQVGLGVEGWSVGDRVCALLGGGGYAEQVAVPVGQLMPVPAGLDCTPAAALPEVACTVWSMLCEKGALAPGEAVLIHGGASGIGTFAIQLARALGARVLTTAGSDAKLAACRELGAEVTINYNTEDFQGRVLEATGGSGVDVVLDIMGAVYLEQNINVLDRDGRLIVLSNQAGQTIAPLDLGRVFSKRLTVHAAGLRSRDHADKAGIVERTIAHVWPYVERGQITPVVDRVLPLENAAEAHRITEAGEHIGKVVLRTT